MRVVIDTIVFISSFVAAGTLSNLIDSWKRGRITLCLSKPIVEEYVDVFKRLGLGNDDEINEILYLFARGFNSIFTAKTPRLEIPENSLHYNKFLECAVALKAKYIVSGEKEALAVQDYMGIKLVTPKQFVDLMEQK
jgi:putative PIN family toxin of toxin-antitoxin system